MKEELKKLKEEYAKAADNNKHLLEEIEECEMVCNKAIRELQGRALITMYLDGTITRQTIKIGKRFKKEVLWSHPSKYAI